MSNKISNVTTDTYNYKLKMTSVPAARDNTSVTILPMIDQEYGISNEDVYYSIQKMEIMMNEAEPGVMDYVNKMALECAPEEKEILGFTIDPVNKKCPEQYLKLGDSKLYYSTDNVEAYNNLPRTADGKIDVEKVRDSLQKACGMIKEQNTEALATFNYGVYKEAINSTNLLVGLLGPEMALIIRKAVECQGKEMPAFLTESISAIDASAVLGFLLNDVTFDTLGTDLIQEFTDVKRADDIKSKIKNDNVKLGKLLNFNLETEDDVKKFLEAYLEFTGTTFSCEKIDKCYELANDPNSKNVDKFIAFATSCGSSENLADAKKNEIMTNALYNGGIRFVIPSIIGKINHPVAKIIAGVLPTYIGAVETLTEGCGEGAMINKDNITYDKIIDVTTNGLMMGFFVLLPSSGWGKKLFSKFKMFKNLYHPDKGTFWGNFFTKLGVKGPRAGAHAGIAFLLSKFLRLMTPDFTAKDGPFRVLCPPYHMYKTIEGWTEPTAEAKDVKSEEAEEWVA